jgi:hypothetical protein
VSRRCSRSKRSARGESEAGDSLVFDRFRVCDPGKRACLCKKFSICAAMHRQSIRPEKTDRVGASFALPAPTARTSRMHKNSLFDRCLLQSRTMRARSVRALAAALAVNADRIAPRALQRAGNAPRTRFVKWNAAFFVVL